MQVWVRGLLVFDVRCKYRDRDSIPNECRISQDVDLLQVNFTRYHPSYVSNTLFRKSPPTLGSF